MFCDRQIAPATKYHYRVHSIGWDGKASEASSITVSTMDKIKLPPLPPSAEHFDQPARAALGEHGMGQDWNQSNVPGGTVAASRKVTNRESAFMPPRRWFMPFRRGPNASSPLPAWMTRKTAILGKALCSRYWVMLARWASPGDSLRSPLLSDETLRIWHFNIELSTRLREIRLVVTDGGRWYRLRSRRLGNCRFCQRVGRCSFKTRPVPLPGNYSHSSSQSPTASWEGGGDRPVDQGSARLTVGAYCVGKKKRSRIGIGDPFAVVEIRRFDPSNAVKTATFQPTEFAGKVGGSAETGGSKRRGIDRSVQTRCCLATGLFPLQMADMIDK